MSAFLPILMSNSIWIRHRWISSRENIGFGYFFQMITNEKYSIPEHQFRIGNSEDEEEQQQSITDSNHKLKKFNQFYDHWLQFNDEIRIFESKHKIYVKQLDEVEALKSQYRIEFNRYKKRIIQLQTKVKELKKTYTKQDRLRDGEEKKNHLKRFDTNLRRNSQSTSDLTKTEHLPSNLHSLTSVDSSPELDQLGNILSPTDRLTLISDRLNSNALTLSRIADTLPRKDPYLKIILGSVDVSILNRTDKWTYKEEYEKFKVTVTWISLISSMIIWLIGSPYRACDALFHFLLVWYYCTLTIRESILVVNGSNIHRKSIV